MAFIQLIKSIGGKHMDREPTTTITVSTRTARTVRQLAGELQLQTGETVTQRMVVDAALDAYTKIKEERS